MSALQNKIDFAMILRVKNANPNGDPLNGNRPRTDYGGLGEITDVCLKRKIRDRLLEDGQVIFVQSDDRKNDHATSLRNRAVETLGSAIFKEDVEMVRQKVCEQWFDVRAFGQVFAYKGEKKGEGVSLPIRGPVTIQSAFSKEPVSITSTQITKSVSGEGDGSTRGSDTMGMKHRVDSGVYVTYGSMNPQLAERTGFAIDDADAIKAVLPKLFENDSSSARPYGSMEVMKVIWWKHGGKSGQYSSAKVHRSLSVNDDGSYSLQVLDGLTPEEIDGF